MPEYFTALTANDNLDATTLNERLQDLEDAIARALLPTPTGVTIASGAISATRLTHVVSAESGTTDDLSVISAAGDCQVLYLRAAFNHTITVKHGTNIVLRSGSDFVLDNNNALHLYYADAKWYEV